MRGSGVGESRDPLLRCHAGEKGPGGGLVDPDRCHGGGDGRDVE